MASVANKRRFCLVLVKPSHYDDDGYVIQWMRASMPSNTLSALYGLATDCAARHALGSDIELDIHALDETNTRIRADDLARLIARAGAGMVMLVGVQSNQFPRALDIARPLRARGIAVCIGGFHVSGVISMLGGVDADLDRAKAMGVSLFAGEAEGRLDDVLRDALRGSLALIYNFIDDLPSIAGEPVPFLPADRALRTAGMAAFDAGRGCPYQCSFCTIINVQGRKSRRRSLDDIEQILRINYAQRLKSIFITDDNFARNKDWEAILDRIIYLRESENLCFTFAIQVDTLCYRLPNFIEKCRRAGVRRAFIGLENINPDNLMAAKKRQNKITEYRQMLLDWKTAGIITYVGYILGFPNDTLESILRDIDVLKGELPVDLVEFFCLTPLPGSEDHVKVKEAGGPLDPDMNHYDNYHITTTHPRMSREEWELAYRLAWQRYYTFDHIETVLRRLMAAGGRPGKAAFLLTWFKGSVDLENIHPLEGGFFRLKFRRDRRPIFPIEPAWRFYPRYFSESAVKLVRWIALYMRIRGIYKAIQRNPDRFQYRDIAISPVVETELETHEMFRTEAAQAYVSQQRRLEKHRHGATV